MSLFGPSYEERCAEAARAVAPYRFVPDARRAQDLLVLVAVSLCWCSRSDREAPPVPGSSSEEGERRDAAQGTAQGRETPHAKIDSDVAAHRLARAIYSDMSLYNTDKVAGHPPERVQEILRDELADGRSLFEARVSPRLRSVYDEEFVFLLRSVSYRLQIDSTDSARYLARTLLQAAMRESNADSLSSAVEEARQFYDGTVAENLHSTFDATAAELGIVTSVR